MARLRVGSMSLIGLVSCLMTAGCSDPYEGRMAISGTITLEGQPLADGAIIFEPAGGQGTTSGASITNGKYTIERKDGLKPGKYTVRITSGDGTTPNDLSEEEAASPGGSTNIVSVDRIPPEYNEKSTQSVDVLADGDNVFDYAIPKAREVRKRR